MSLSSLIVQREIATIRQVEEALARQVLYGGDLATNLLEVAPIEEWRLAVTYADSFNLPAAPPGRLPTPPAELLSLIPAEIASKRTLIPLSGDAKALVVATSEPLSPLDQEQLVFSLGVKMEARIALYPRVREVLALAYGIPLDRRIERLLAKLTSASQEAPISNPSSLKSAILAGAARPSSVPPPFKLSSAYGVSALRSPLAPQNREETPSVPEIETGEREEPMTPAVRFPIAQPSAPVEPEPFIPVPRSTRAGFPAPAPNSPVDATPAPAVTVPAPARHATDTYPAAREAAPPAPATPSTPAPATFVKATTNVARPIRRRRGPLTFKTAKAELEQATDRDALLDLFFEFARQYFDYSALFIAHGDIAEGRDAFGDGTPGDKVVGIGVPLDLPSMLATAREQKTPVFVRPAAGGIDEVLMGDLRRSADVEALVLPVLVRGRAVALLYADAGSTGIDRTAIDDVLAFATLTGQGFERLIVRKKLVGFAAGTPKTAAGKLDLGAAPLPLPTKTPSGPPQDKVSRAATLGRALFGKKDGDGAGALPSDRPGAFAPEPEPSEPPSPWSRTGRTSPETPQARGIMPPVLAPGAEVPVQQSPEPHAPPVAPPGVLVGRPPRPRSQHPSNRPPPPQVTAVRRPSGPPIPREEPGSPTMPAVEHARMPTLELVEAAPLEIESETLDDAEAQALLAELEQEPPAEVMPLAPESEQAVAYGPRRPPTAHSEATLPKIIVDIAGELSILVERVLAGNDEGTAEAELLRQGAGAMPAIMARFPGPLLRARADMIEPLPRASECGPLLRLIARQRKVALPYVLEEVASPDVSRRFWATLLLAELAYPEGARALVPRLFDPDAKVRLVAREAARSMAQAAHEALLGEMGRMLREPSTSRTARLGLLEALGELREAMAVPILIQHVGDEDPEVATVARRSLIAITRQDFGLDARRWLGWWGQNSARHRVEWLIDALVDETPGIRRAAGDELKAVTEQTFGYYDDLPKRERERAQQRFRDWWASEGRARFMR